MARFMLITEMLGNAFFTNLRYMTLKIFRGACLQTPQKSLKILLASKFFRQLAPATPDSSPNIIKVVSLITVQHAVCQIS